MKYKKFYEDPALEILRFRMCDLLTVSGDPDGDEDDYVELPIDPA